MTAFKEAKLWMSTHIPEETKKWLQKPHETKQQDSPTRILKNRNRRKKDKKCIKADQK